VRGPKIENSLNNEMAKIVLQPNRGQRKERQSCRIGWNLKEKLASEYEGKLLESDWTGMCGYVTGPGCVGT
jgi:hypothetical protein